MLFPRLQNPESKGMCHFSAPYSTLCHTLSYYVIYTTKKEEKICIEDLITAVTATNVQI
jgi:hypothetical protein